MYFITLLNKCIHIHFMGHHFYENHFIIQQNIPPCSHVNVSETLQCFRGVVSEVLRWAVLSWRSSICSCDLIAVTGNSTEKLSFNADTCKVSSTLECLYECRCARLCPCMYGCVSEKKKVKKVEGKKKGRKFA